MVLKQLFLIAYSYTCGSARLFNVTLKKGSPPVQRPNQTMTCQWNTTWTPTAVLPVMVPPHKKYNVSVCKTTRTAGTPEKS